MERIFNNNREIEPVYKYWRLKESWYLYIRLAGFDDYNADVYEVSDYGTAIPLLLNVEPNIFKDFLENLDDRKLDIYNKVLTLFTVSLENGSLKHWSNYGGRWDTRQIDIRPSDLIRWAVSIDFPVAELFLVLLEQEDTLIEVNDNALKLHHEKQPDGEIVIGEDINRTDEDKDHLSMPRHGEHFICEDVRSWSQVSFMFVSDHVIEITAGSNRYNKTFDELGFKGYGAENPSILWGILEVFASHGGVLQSQLLPDKLSRRKNLKNDISSIRNILREMFPKINSNPIEWDKRYEGYTTKFKLFIKQERPER